MSRLANAPGLRSGYAGASGTDWQSAFLAFSVLVGESLADSVASLSAAPPGASAALAVALSPPASREARAAALARVVAAVSADLDALEWA